MRGSIRKNAFFNPLTLTLSRKERGLKPFLRKSCIIENTNNEEITVPTYSSMSPSPTRESATCCSPGRPGWGAGRIPGQPRHPRAPGRAGPGQRAVANRPCRGVRGRSRCAARLTRGGPRRGATAGSARPGADGGARAGPSNDALRAAGARLARGARVGSKLDMIECQICKTIQYLLMLS